MNSAKLFTPPVLFVLLLQSYTCSIYHDSITQQQPIRDGDTLISSGQVFALGFFSPPRSTRRFLGIWYYKVPVQTVVWVANRDSPVTSGSGVLSLMPQGNLLLQLGNNDTVWSSNASSTTNPYPTARLLDSGNLVLLKNDNTTVIWQSFDHPTDTYLPAMKLGVDRRTGLNRVYSSWISEDDPGTGNYSYAVDPTGYPQLFLYKGEDPRWRVGSWTGAKFTGVPEMTSNFIFTVTFVNNQDEVYALYGVRNESILTRMVVESSGFVGRSTWNDQRKQWIRFWYAPKEPCDYYKDCGIYSVCDPSNAELFNCKCLPGFRPKSSREWDLRDGSGGCVRNEGASVCGNGEGFVKMRNVKLPDTKVARVDMSLNLEACEKECERNCSCKAYASADERGIGCMTWHGDIVDARKYSDMGQDLYVRVDSVTLAKENEKASPRRKWMLPLFICIALFMVVVIIFGCWRLSRKRRGNASGRQIKYSFSSLSERGTNEDLATFFDLATIAAATDNFSFANKLGQGGFGPVYKGHMVDGKDIAVKRLSKSSGQGTEEFKNEVSLIAKLQHRNLVRILGCCIEGEEKMLIYEYLPNKSLDFFLFDEAKRSLLDWKKRFNIAHGVARGILYLHEDSRLRIIHRDLKASNVLLDDAMNPKISDFGMARIFGGDQIQGCTRRVVGTYGYMAPEYAMEGLFSIKSDVYSFGVMLLELVTGKRNSGYYHESWPSNLIGHVWELWKEGRPLELVDETMKGSYEREEAMRCVQIGLLCVQECAGDRPTMSAVVFMLGNNDTTYQLPSPSQPAFTCKTSDKTASAGEHTASSSQGACSANHVTLSLVQPR